MATLPRSADSAAEPPLGMAVSRPDAAHLGARATSGSTAPASARARCSGRSCASTWRTAAMPLLTTKRVYWKTATREMLWFLTGETNIRPLLRAGRGDLDRLAARRATAARPARTIAREDFSKRGSSRTRLSPRAGAISARSTASNGSTGRPTSRRATGCFAARARASTRSPSWSTSLRGQPRQPPPHHRGLERRRARRDGAAAVPQDLPVPRRRTTGCQRPALPAQLRRRARASPFNLWAPALLTRMLAQQAGLEPGELVWMGGDVHLYLNHAELVEEQLAREPRGRAAA